MASVWFVAYSDADLATAINVSRSWRGVLRQLGLSATSAGSMRAVRRRADVLGIDHGHFTGQRRWSDGDFADAVSHSQSWAEVMTRLGLANGGYRVDELRQRAHRLALDHSHLDPRIPVPDERFAADGDPELLRSAAACLAAAWFQLRGCAVSWPLEPARYDLLVESAGTVSRIQVKTTVATGSTRGAVSLSASRRAGRATYGTDEIDYFFIIDRELDAFLIPVDVVSGRYTIMLSAYESFRVVVKGGWLTGYSATCRASP